MVAECPAHLSVSGWTWLPGGDCSTLSSWSEVQAAWDKGHARIWIDLNNPTREDIQFLDGIIDLDDGALMDCLDIPKRPRIDEYQDYLALFFYGVLSVDEQGQFAPHKIAAFCGKRFLVTIHPEPMLSVNALQERCQKNGAAMFERGVDVLLYRLVDTLVDNYLALVDHLEIRVNSAEAASFEPATDDSILRKVAQLRIELMEVRRLASTQRLLLVPLARGEFDYVSGNLGTEFQHIEEHLAHTLDCIEGLRERLSGALQNYHSTLTKRTNDIVRVLTVFAAIVLPLSLIAGIYGMNVPTRPSGDDAGSFWLILAFMVAVGGGLLCFFKIRKWF